MASLRHFKVGQVIYLEGEPAESVYILKRGRVKASRMTREGREQVMLFLPPVEALLTYREVGAHTSHG